MNQFGELQVLFSKPTDMKVEISKSFEVPMIISKLSSTYNNI